MNNYDDQLWSQLVRERGEQMSNAPATTAALASSVTATITATRPASRMLHRPALLTGSALGIACLAGAGVLALSSASPAFAVTKNSDGTVAVTLSDLADLPALNRELAQDGIPVTAVPISASCSATGAITNPSGDSGPGNQENQQSDVVTLDPSQIPSGDVGVLGVSQTSSGQVTLLYGDTTAPAPSCLSSTAFSGSLPGDTSTRGRP